MDIRRPTLVVGLGGTGCGAAERIYADGVRLKLVERRMLAVIGLDTDENDHERLALRETQKVRFSTGSRIIDLIKRNPEIERTWFYQRTELGPDLLNMSLLDGAGQVRMLTRLALADAFRHGNLENALRAPLLELTTVANQAAYKGQINVLLVGSLAGGTGCGSFLQVALALREIAEVGRLAKLVVRGIFLLPDVYVRGAGFSRDHVDNVLANATAALRELNATMQVTGGQGSIDRLDFEYMPGKRLRHGQLPFDVVTLIDYEMRNGQTLGRNLESYKDLLYRTAYTQLFLPLGQEIDQRSVNSVLQKLSGAALGSANSYASFGTFTIVYPEAEILDHLVDRFAAGVLEGDWLELDRVYRRKVQAYEDRRRQGDVSAKFPDRGETFIADLDQMARDRRPLILDIYKNVHREEEQSDGSILTRVRYLEYLDAFEAYVVGEFQRVNESVREAYSGSLMSASQLGERSDLDSAVRRRETGLDRTWNTLQDAARQEPDGVYDNAWSTGLALGEAEWQNHHIQKHIVAPAPHLVEVRYFLYHVLREIDRRIAALNPEDFRNTVVKASGRFEEGKTAAEGRRSAGGVLVRANEIAQEGTVARMFSKRFSEFVETYVGYHNKSLQNMRLYAETQARKRCLERLRADLAEIVRMLEMLFSDLEAMQGELAARITEVRDKHVGADGASSGKLYVFASAEAKDAIWDQIKTETLGARIGREANSRLVSALFGEIKRRRASRLGSAAAAEFTVRDLFKQHVIDGYCRRRLTDDLSDAYSMNVAEAIKRDAARAGRAFDAHAEGLVRIVAQQAQPFIQLTDGIAPPELIYWAMHPETEASLGGAVVTDRLFRHQEQASAIVGEEYPRTELMCVDVVYNFPILRLSKLVPGDRNSRSVYDDAIGRYDARYRDCIDALVASEGGHGGMRSRLTPHLHRDWHTAAGLPEIFPDADAKSRGDVYRGFVAGLGLDLVRREIVVDAPVTAFYDPARMQVGGARQEICRSHALDQILGEFKRRPELARASLAGLERLAADLARSHGGGPSQATESFERFCSPDLLADIVAIARDQRNPDLAESEMVAAFKGYVEVLRALIDARWHDLVGDRRSQQFQRLLFEIYAAAMARVEERRLLSQDVLQKTRVTLDNVLRALGAPASQVAG